MLYIILIITSVILGDLAFARRFAEKLLVVLREFGVPPGGELAILELGLGKGGGDHWLRVDLKTGKLLTSKEIQTILPLR